MKDSKKTSKKKETKTCITCGVKPGQNRIDNGLPAGVHCEECWDKMIFECRQRSW